MLWVSLVFPALAQTAVPDTTIVTLSINNRLTQDFEILQWPDGEIAVPVKYLAEILDVSAQLAYQTNAVSFRDPVSGESVLVDVDNQSVHRGGQPMSGLRHPLVRKTDGLFAQDDIYLDEALAEQVFHVQLSFEVSSQTVVMEIDRDIKLLLSLPSEGGRTGVESDEEASKIVIQAPEESGRFLEAITLETDGTVFQETQSQTASKSRFFNSAVQWETGLRGYVARMPYRIEPRWAFRNGDYGMADLNWHVEKRGEKNYWQAGSLITGLSPLVTPFIPLWGLQMSSYNASGMAVNPSGSQTYQGEATLKGRVFINVNDVQMQSQVPVEGQYRFEEVPLQSERLNKIRIYQRGAEGKDVVLYEAMVPYYSQTLRQGENAYSMFMGRAPVQFQPPGFGINTFVMPQSNKWVTGGRFFHGLTDRLTWGIAAAGDNIFGPPETSPFGGLLNTLQIPDLTGYLSYGRDPNFWSGANVGTTFNYRLKDHWTLLADGSTSFRQRFSNVLRSDKGPVAMAGQVAARYKRERFMGNVRLFHYDTDFYTPTMIGSNSLYDRKGGAIEASGLFKGFSYNSGVERYWTNLSEVLDGGEIAINRWNGSIGRQFNNKTDARFRYTWLDGASDVRSLDVKDMQFEFNRLLPHGIRWYLSAKRTNNELTQATLNPFFDSTVALTTRSSNIINIVYTDFQMPLFGDWGTVNVGGNFSKEVSLLNFQSRLQFKRLVLEPIIQKSFAGNQDLLIAGVGVYYEKPNGQHIGFRYTYNFSSIPLLALQGLGAAPIEIGATDRGSHQLQFDFTDALAFLGGRIFSMGREIDTTGFVEGMVFLDLNQNGKQDQDEPGVPNIPVKMNGENDYQSNDKGKFATPNLYPGTYAFNFDFPNLPINLTPTTPTIHAQVKPGRRTRVKLGVIVTPGIISGTVKLHDAMGNSLNPADMILILKDGQGKESQFTYVDAKGRYSFNDLPPGTYQVSLDVKQAEDKHYETQSGPDKILIPVDYENFVERDHNDFDVLQLMRLP